MSYGSSTRHSIWFSPSSEALCKEFCQVSLRIKTLAQGGRSVGSGFLRQHPNPGQRVIGAVSLALQAQNLSLISSSSLCFFQEWWAPRGTDYWSFRRAFISTCFWPDPGPWAWHLSRRVTTSEPQKWLRPRSSLLHGRLLTFALSHTWLNL